jgi:tetratricopeptide (TPR) repeat protein
MDNKKIIDQISHILDTIQQICQNDESVKLSSETVYLLDEIERMMFAVRRSKADSSIGLEINQKSPDDHFEFAVKKIEQIPHIEFTDEQRTLLDIEIGKAYFLLGDLDGAKKKFESAVSIADRLGNMDAKADAFKRLGDIAYRRNKFDEAESIYLESLKLYEHSENFKGKADIYNDLGTIAFYGGDWNKVEDFFNKCLDIAEQSNHIKLLAKVNNNLGASYTVRGRYEDAISYYTEALLQFEQLGDASGVAEVYVNMGACHAHRGDWIKAGDCYENSIQHSKEADNIYLTALAYTQRAELCIQMSDYAVAKFYCDQAINIFLKIGHQAGLVDAYKLLGSINRKLKQFDMAKVYLDKALAICRIISNKINEAEILAEHARLAKSMGNEEEANQNYHLAISEFVSIGANERADKLKKEIIHENENSY